jgi:hypothetical protein
MNEERSSFKALQISEAYAISVYLESLMARGNAMRL